MDVATTTATKGVRIPSVNMDWKRKSADDRAASEIMTANSLKSNNRISQNPVTDVNMIQNTNDIINLINKVNMNKGFTRLAANDQALVDEMTVAIKELWEDARKRQIIYIAIEHNVKYITQMC